MPIIKIDADSTKKISDNLDSFAGNTYMAQKYISEVIPVLDEMQFRAKEEIIEQLENYKKRLNRQYSLGKQYKKAVSNTYDALCDVDDSLSDSVENVWTKVEDWTSYSSNTPAPFASCALVQNQSAVTNTLIAGGTALSFVSIAQKINGIIKEWFGMCEENYIFGKNNNYQNEMQTIERKIVDNDDVTWNYLEGETEQVYRPGSVGSVSCVWFSAAKLFERGLVNDISTNEKLWTENSNTVVGENYTNFETAVGGLEQYIRNNKNKPVYNVLIKGENYTHTVLIDKAYIDENDQLKMVFSDNADGGGTLDVKTNGNGGTEIMSLRKQKEYSAEEVQERVWSFAWNTEATTRVYIYGKAK